MPQTADPWRSSVGEDGWGERGLERKAAQKRRAAGGSGAAGGAGTGSTAESGEPNRSTLPGVSSFNLFRSNTGNVVVRHTLVGRCCGTAGAGVAFAIARRRSLRSQRLRASTDLGNVEAVEKGPPSSASESPPAGRPESGHELSPQPLPATRETVVTLDRERGQRLVIRAALVSTPLTTGGPRAGEGGVHVCQRLDAAP